MLTKLDFLNFIDTPLHLWGLKHGIYKKFKSNIEKQFEQNREEVNAYAEKYIVQYISKDFEKKRVFKTETITATSDFTIFNPITNKYDIYEIKTSTEIKPSYEYDIAFQYHIASQIIDIGNIYILYLNKDYMMNEEIDLKALFMLRDMTQIAKFKEVVVREYIKDAISIIQMPNKPDIQGCLKLKTCPCPQLCFPNLFSNSIYNLTNLDKERLLELRDLGVEKMIDIPEDFHLGLRQKLQIQSLKENRPIINEERLRSFLNRIIFPVYFLDYEAYSWAIPKYNNSYVYQTIVFQYSLHKIMSKEFDHTKSLTETEDISNLLLEHYEYISTNKVDITEKLIVDLLKNIGDHGSILVWNKEFEMKCNREMARMYPEYKEELLNLNNRIIDLGDIFSKHIYVDHKFKGSWSIKNILPILVPELTYTDLGISNGIEAMNSWYDLVFKNDLLETERLEIKNYLLKYCGLDSYAMVAILNYLVSFKLPSYKKEYNSNNT